MFSSTIHTYEQLSGQNIDIGQVLEGYMLGRKEALINGNWQADEEKMTTLLVNLILETDHG